jgi:dolichyl-diphosphooligosaccharide--protein glycosyltransferase
VSEHQPTTWTTLFFDLHFTLLLAPIGLYYTLRNTTRGKLFIALYFVVSLYFASVMVRLILVLFPAICIISAIGISEFLT